MHYIYLIYSLFFLAVLGVSLFFRRDLIKDAVPALLFGSVAGPVSELLYLSDYWRPPSVLRIGGVAIEDILFGIAVFGLSLVLYPWVLRKRLSPVAAGNDRHLRTFGTLAVGAVLVAVLVVVIHINSVFATALTFVALWLAVGVLRHDLLLPGLLSGGLQLVLALFMYGVLLNIFVSRQDLEELWLLHGTRLGVTILGKVPVSELAWFFSVGCFLSVFELFVNKRHYIDFRGEQPNL